MRPVTWGSDASYAAACPAHQQRPLVSHSRARGLGAFRVLEGSGHGCARPPGVRKRDRRPVRCHRARKRARFEWRAGRDSTVSRGSGLWPLPRGSQARREPSRRGGGWRTATRWLRHGAAGAAREQLTAVGSEVLIRFNADSTFQRPPRPILPGLKPSPAARSPATPRPGRPRSPDESPSAWSPAGSAMTGTARARDARAVETGAGSRHCSLKAMVTV